MQHSGIPTQTHQKGYGSHHAETAVHRTFQIKTFSTELKNHVMVMDFVKSNWFPSQRRAKVCIIRLCQGLKTAEQTSSRYEIHSRLFSSPKNHSAWEGNESLLNTGLRDNHYGTSNQIAFTNLPSDVTEKKSDFTEETLASPNTKMTSSLLISQLIDESKSRDNGAMLPLPCMAMRPPTRHLKPSLANRSGVNIHRVFALLPGRLGIPTPSEERGPERELPPKEENPCSGPQKGFASITITARRVGPPASALVWGTVGGPLCPKCRAQDTLLQEPPAVAEHAYSQQHTQFSRNGSVMRLKVPEAHAQLCEGHEYWVTHVDDKETSFSPDVPPSEKGPLVFSSCVHLRVSRQCPNSAYYLDKPLSVPVEQPPVAGPQVHRSVLSLTLNCSSHRLTAGGVDGLVNGEPMGRALKQELTEGSQGLLGRRWNPGVLESHLATGNPSVGQVHLGTTTCPWSGSPVLENTVFADVGTNQVTVSKRAENQVKHRHPSGCANQLSIHIPGWSYAAGDRTCCDLVVKIKECQKHEDPTMPEPSPVPPTQPERPDPSEDCSKPQQTPANSLTLQEALEVHKPQFISRSQERLRKLEHMVQQRRAQPKEDPGQKQSLLPVRASKKQFTIPHPLSDNLFKPKERCISEKEMHLRSKRIYNNLPEVKKKKEEQRKRVILQSNRLRAEVFKKVMALPPAGVMCVVHRCQI
ncbi:(E2-independent) E3 ubiquitin-conjugating enzyme FATS isoform X5 [Nycticebus coucang]|uniref:(E2-independent) E3 ubiquitin-conjugating enzyme FATS isoform X5 n=1 Tax=Nycticebus coucang TaxID=9470 RepID=UPI00234CD877|nr:(E2-independent) E3 ubiquitin-conjugating enzyme FATS isoform X5 [Nycticebus coucang]